MYLLYTPLSCTYRLKGHSGRAFDELLHILHVCTISRADVTLLQDAEPRERGSRGQIQHLPHHP